MLNSSRLIPDLLSWRNIVLACGGAGILMLLAYPTSATEPSIPWQCTSYTYTGNSQLECIQSLKEEQNEKIDKLERQLKRQQIIIEELKDQMDRQSRRASRDVPAYPPSYGFGPPPVGIGPLPIYGYGNRFGFGVGPLPFLPPIAIVID